MEFRAGCRIPGRSFASACTALRAERAILSGIVSHHRPFARRDHEVGGPGTPSRRWKAPDSAATPGLSRGGPCRWASSLYGSHEWDDRCGAQVSGNVDRASGAVGSVVAISALAWHPKRDVVRVLWWP